jgi:hypothetical protein
MGTTDPIRKGMGLTQAAQSEKAGILKTGIFNTLGTLVKIVSDRRNALFFAP